MKNRNAAYVAIIILAALVLGFINLPTDEQKKLFPYTPDFILNNKINLGLDLQGGSQLDYKIDLRTVPAKDQKSIVDGILNVINKRVNSLGVSEPNIYTSDVGDEKHLIVELAGVKDLEEAKGIVGKTIQLEFKEQRTGPADPNEAQRIKDQAINLLNKIKAGGDFKLLGNEESQSAPDKISYNESKDFQYKDQITSNLADELFKAKPGDLINRLIENSGNMTVDDTGNLVELKGYHIVKLLEKRDQEREINTPRSVKVSHVLISYKGATKADASISRSEADAQKLADDIVAKLNAGTKFEDLAKQYSDDTGSKDKGGALDEPIVSGKGTYVKEFEDAGFALNKTGQVSPVVKSIFGFHIIKADSITEAKTEKKVEPQIKYADIFFNAMPDSWQETGLNGQHFVHADVEFNQAYNPYVSIQFNDEGAKLFDTITGRNIGKPIAIFVGGQRISAPNVNERISGGRAQITGRFTIEEANSLARDLNTGAIPAPIILVGQYSIGATLGQDALNKSVWAGLIGFLLVAIFMIGYYRLPGLLATAALSIYACILIFLIKVALPLPVALGISIIIFIFLLSAILKNKEGTAEKAISLILACFILFFVTFLLSSSVVMTLAGIAGVVLSIGMAVDANILIFERVKEELRDGRSLGSAIEVGFDRAWNSIRDSNFSSLITCGILFYFGSSIIQGFAFNLAAGILVSMFTAITVSKTFITALASTRLAQNLWLFGNPKKKEKKLLPIVQNRKIVYVISLIMVGLSLIGIPFVGIKMGMDFTGGTQMEFKLPKSVTADALKTALVESAKTVNDKIASPATKTTNSTQQTKDSSTTELSSASEKIDFSDVKIIPTNDGVTVKSKHISTDAHDLLIAELKNKFGKDFEENKFSTVGPTVGTSMQYKAIMAVIVASIMIICYIAFAFRKVPKFIGKWRFGTTAVIALIHDLIVMLGVYIYLGAIFGVEIDALFITAMLTILGFSVHDTIVVFDRIREKLRFQKRDESFEDVANQAVNETVARSINTSLSVFFTLLALVVFGSESIKFFNLSLMVGVICGTYSSIFVATPLLVDWHNYARKQKK